MTVSLLRPHTLPALRVTSAGGNLRPGVLSVADFLAEPSINGSDWQVAVVRRLIGMSTGPVAVGVKEVGASARFEAAGWFNAMHGADHTEARAACWSSLPTLRRLSAGYGSPRPSIVLVTDRAHKPGQLPLASLHGAHLFRALRLLGYDELTVYVTTAVDHKRKRRPKQLEALHDVFSAGHPVWIPVGRQAEKALKQAKIRAADYVPAPQHHLRTSPEQGVKGYAALINEAALSFGPYYQLTPPGLYPCELPELPAPYDLADVRTRRRTGGGKGQGQYRDVVKIQAARRDYVLGNSPTIDHAAGLHGLSPGFLRRVAGSEGWVAERDAHHRGLTERAKEETARAEVKAQSNCRKLAWVANQRLLTTYVRLTGQPDYVPTAREIEAINRVCLALSGAGVGSTDSEREAMSKLPLLDLARQTLESITKGLGGE